MNKNKNTSFLVELLISTLVFCIACAILFSVFTTAMLKAKDTRNQSQANTKITSLFETLREREVEDSFPRAVELEPGNYAIYYNDLWNETSEEDAEFSLVFQVEDRDAAPGILRHINADIYRVESDDASAILSMQTAWFRRG